MKKILINVLLIILISATKILGIANLNAESNIEIKVNYSKKKVPDTIVLMVLSKFAYLELPTKYFAFRRQNNTFKFQVPNSTVPSLISLGYYNSGKFLSLTSKYYMQSGDKITIRIFETQKGDSTIINGTGSPKYNLIERLVKDEISYGNNSEQSKTSPTPQEYIAFLNRSAVSLENQIVKKRSIIESFKESIDSNIKDLIDYQFANYDRHWTGMIYTKYKEANPSLRSSLKSYVNSKYKPFLSYPKDISILSPDYYLYLLNSIRLKELVNSKSGMGDLVSFYNSVKNYSSAPRIRERLLSQFLTGSYALSDIVKVNSSVYDSIVRDASKYLLSSSGKAIIHKKLKLATGTDLFDTHFTDLNGKKIDTYSLRGKVFILDVWTTGCKGCVQFHQMFDKELWPKLKHNKDFAFLSVYINTTKNQWLYDLNRGIYSSLEYMNVYTGEGVGQNHPFIKYYQITAVPFLLFIDKNGKIIQKVDNTVDATYVLSLINKGLEKPCSK